ncbi:MAG: hypothetical protein ACTHMZ_07675 [Actinomycetes bacterium]
MRTVGNAIGGTHGNASGVCLAEATTGATQTPSDRAMQLLGAHIPLALLVDLAAEPPIDSRELLASEGHPDTSWWLVDVREPGCRQADFSGSSER